VRLGHGVSKRCARKEIKMAPTDKHDSTKIPISNPTNRESNRGELEKNGDMASQESKLGLGALGEYLSEENLERFGRETGELAAQSKAKAERFVHGDLRDLANRAKDVRRDVKTQFESQIAKIEPKAERLGTKIGGGIRHVRPQVEDLSDTTKGYWKTVKLFLRRHRWALLIGLITLVFIVTGHPEYILYTLLHLVMIIFATAHTIIGILSIIFDNLFEIELFSSLGYAVYNVTYAFYSTAFYITDSIMIWLQWIHIFT
jgi:hypothetical protein